MGFAMQRSTDARPEWNAGCRRRDARRGLTLVETVAVVSLLGVLTAALTPILSQGIATNGRTVSLKNLVLLGEAQACYAADWSERQFSTSPKLLGTVNGNCNTYVSTVGCPNPVLLGWDPSGSAWGYYVGSSGLCAGTGFPGFCGNLAAYKPMSFSGSDAFFGAFRLPNVRGMQEYVAGAFYRPTYFSTLDFQAWESAKPFFSVEPQFPGSVAVADFRYSSYVFSPAAMFHPGVLRRPSAGGFQNPNAGFSNAYDVPAQSMCSYPDLKSRMIEHNWLVDPPALANPAFAGSEPYYFNHGIDSKPGVLYFDGSVDEMTMQQAVDDDAAALLASGGIDGLWSRDTPIGADGYFGAQAYDDTRNSFHILTTDGILGRDFLHRSPQQDAAQSARTPHAARRGGAR